MRGVAVDLVGDGPADRQVEGIRREQRVVVVDERLVDGGELASLRRPLLD